MLTWDFENGFFSDEYKVICGCDEAGRGPLAGEVAAAAVILPKGLIIPELNDSKKLSEKKREKLYDEITQNAVAYGIATSSVEEIEELNILGAALLAMGRAIEKLPCTPDLALIDGNVTKGFTLPAKAVIGGDAKCPDIAAASILAKVTRDRICYKLDELYPQYGFAKHKGYGTKEHVEAIKKYGVLPIHRKKFLRKILDE